MQKIIFAGTTEFGIPTLEQLKKNYELVLVITQPAKPTGRNQQLTSPPVKVWAQKNNIPVEQPEKINDLRLRIKDLKPDLLLVAAYGQIIPKEILDLPKFGSINIHGSVLPKYRGASPIQATLANGDKSVGISLLKMDEQMDHGPVIAIQTMAVDNDDNFLTLYKKLSVLSADLVLKILPDYFGGKIQPQPQNHSQATFTKLLTRQDGKIDWAKPALEIRNKIRAYNPEPGTWTTLGGKIVKILETEIFNDHKIELPGKLYVANDDLAVKCVDYSLLLKKVKPEGKNEMTGKDFLNGLKSLNDKLFL